MRYVSEHFKEVQSEIIRPALSLLTLEIGTDTINTFNAIGGSINTLDFDTSVAPVVAPKNCQNKRYYAVLGEESAIDDPNRICAPDNSGVIAKPNHSVPYGITPYKNANERAMIGDDYIPSLNFKGLTAPIQFSFVGGHLPTRIDIEFYDENQGLWITDKAYEDLGGIKTLTYTPDSYDKDKLYHFEVQATTPGRYQLSYIQLRKSRINNSTPVNFTINQIAKADINTETDLTSQSLPDYEMTVECLDVNEQYTPESSYWDNQFKEGSPCFLCAAYKINGVNEFVDLMIGKLKEKPSYRQGKITFKIAVDWRKDWVTTINPVLDDSLNAGDNVGGTSFWQIVYNGKLFDEYDVDNNATVEKVGEVSSENARQLIANALGCYIKDDFGSCNLYDANALQYGDISEYITRYDQVQSALESKPKVGRISVSKTLYTVSSDYVEATTSASAAVGTDEKRYALFSFNLPFYPTGKYEIIDTQQSDPDAVITIWGNAEAYKLDDGTFEVLVPLSADIPTSIMPTIRFYKVDENQTEETETIDTEVNGEVYTNDNEFVTNSYVANKVKGVAHLVSDISNQYEVDVIQDLRYEVGDLIMLETEKNVFKPCVITGIKFELPGSKGHITCRRLFSITESGNAVDDPVGLSLSFALTSIEVTEASERAAYIGIMNTPTTRYIYVLGVETFEQDISGTVTQESYNATLTDLNNHVWKFAYFTIPSGVAINTGAPIVDLPDYDYTKGTSEGAFGAISLLKAIYQDQGMTAPVDYACVWNEL